MLKLIMCLDLKNGISKNNAIPWNLEEDLKHFKKITLNHTVVMGRKTFDTLTKPLANRRNIVFSNQKDIHRSDVEFTNDLQYIIDLSKNEDVFITGGKSIVDLFFPYLDEIILSKTNKNYNCDLFVELDLKNFDCYNSVSFDEFTIKWYRKINSKILYGSTIANEEIEDLKNKNNSLIKKYNVTPTLAIIAFDDDFKTMSYIKAKQRIASLIGVKIHIYKINEPFYINLKNKIIELNNDRNIHGILVQHPFPLNVNVNEICSLINPYKDVDCFNPMNISKIWFPNKETNNCILPCTPNAIIKILKFYKIQIKNKRVVIVGRSIIVGKPLLLLFLNENATVTICHSKTIDLKNICLEADILICAIGKANFFDDTYIKRDAVVIDVGVNKTIDNIICGDVDFDKVYNKASYITPVPKGVGPVTLIELYSNLLNVYENQLKR
ncbi:MAG: dihydrofolate reductase [Malacoplasma sp.]